MKRVRNLLLMGVLLITVSTAMAQGPRFRGGYNNAMQPNRMLCTQLNLTAEQEQKIDDLRIKHLNEVTALQNEMNEKYARLRTLESANKPDMDAINKTIDEISSLKTQLMKKSAAHRAEVASLLTDEQRVLFNSRGRGMRMKGYGRMRGGRGLGSCMNNY